MDTANDELGAWHPTDDYNTISGAAAAAATPLLSINQSIKTHLYNNISQANQRNTVARIV